MERNYLEICKDLIADKLQWGDYSTWKERNFKSLSKQIQEKTEIYISPHTLKRLFNKIKTSDNYLPQPTTQDSLAMFIGYKDWDHYIESIRTIPSKKLTDSLSSPISISRNKKRSSKKYTLFVMVLISTLVISYFIISKISDTIHKNKVSWTIFPEAASAPATIEINTTLKNKPNNNYYIIFNDSYKKKKEEDSVSLKLKKETNVHYYAFPGLYNIELYYKKDKILNKMVCLYSNDWIYEIIHPNRIMLTSHSSSLLKADNKEISQHLDTNSFFQTSFNMYKDFNVNTDSSFLLSFDFRKNLFQKDTTICNYFILGIGGNLNYFILKLSEPKCYSFSYYTGIDKDIDNKRKMLSIDMHDFKNLIFKKNNDTIQVYIDNNQIANTTYKPIGKLYNISFNFSTTGEVKNIFVKQGNRVMYSEFVE